MSKNVSHHALIGILTLTLMAGCAAKTPLEAALASRAAYKATLNSFFVRETPLVDPAEDASIDPAAEGATGEEPADETEGAGVEPDGEGGEEVPVEVPTRLDAVLDIIVQHDTADPLDGVTVDITMVDGNQNEVGHWKLWVDTAGLPKANQRPYSHVLEGVEYEEGYGFNVEIREGIPAAEYGDYRELSGLGS